jgi:hypothetical protein|eukprot:SAG25_NODE_2397_length_1650_cov_1.160542_2_plen_115_part_00
MSTMHAMRTEAASMLLPPQGCSTSGLVEHMQRAFCKECILGADMRRMPPVRPPACARPCCCGRRPSRAFTSTASCALGAARMNAGQAQLENFKQQHQGFAEVFAVRQTQAQIAG